MNKNRKEEQGGNKPILPRVNGYARLLLPILLLLTLAPSLSYAASCGVLPSSIRFLILSCIPANIVNTQGTGTATNFQMAFNALPFNAIAGNVVVYNGISGALVPSWAESNSLIWSNLGTNTITSSGSANGVYYFGIGASGTNFFIGGNQIGEAPQLSSTYAQYDNGNTVFNFYDNFSGTTLKTKWTNGGGSTVNNGLSIAGANSQKGIYSVSTYNMQTNTLDSYVKPNILPAPGGNDYVLAYSTISGLGMGGFWITVMGGTSNWNGLSLAPNFWTPSLGTASNTVYQVIGAYQTGTTNYANLNYAPYQSTTGTYVSETSAYLSESVYATGDTMAVYWTRLRGTPPNGVLPTTSYLSPLTLPLPIAATIYLQNSTANPAISFPSLTGVPACPANFMGGTCQGTDTISGTNTLNNNLFVFGNIIQNSGTLTTNGFIIVASGTFNGMGGNIIGGAYGVGGAGSSGGTASMGSNVPLSYAGSGGGGAHNGGGGNGGAGGNTLVAGGGGGTAGAGGPGANDIAAISITNANVLSWYLNGTVNYLGSASGGGASNTGGSSGQMGGQGSYPIYIQAKKIIAGTTNTMGMNGQSGSATTAGGGGGAITIFAYGTGGYVPGTCLSAGGTGSGAGGNGACLTYSYSTMPIAPSISEYYPINIYNSTTPNIIYTINQIYNGMTTTLYSSVTSFSYVPPSTQPSGIYIYSIAEYNTTDSITFTQMLNISINMTDLKTGLTFNSPIIQYFPNFANCPTWTASPTSWYIKSDNAQSYGAANQPSPCGGAWSNANLSFFPNVMLSYGSPHWASFSLNAINNPLLTTITQSQFKFITANTPTNAPYQRNIMTFNTFGQKTFLPLIANTSIFLTGFFNNYTILNTTAFNANSFSLYIGNSLYANPKITITKLTLSTMAASHVLAVNNYCGFTKSYGSQPTNFNIYPVDNLNGSYYTFNIYSGFGTSPINNYLLINEGVDNLSATTVEQYQIQQVPFQLPLIQGGSYSFTLLNTGCTPIFSTNYSIWTSPIILNLPTSGSTPVLQLSNPRAVCTITWNSIVKYSTINCLANDSTGIVRTWQIAITNASALGALQSYTVNTMSFFNSNSITYSYSPLGNQSQYITQVCAIQNSSQAPRTCFSFALTSFFVNSYDVPADGLIALLFLIVGAGMGVVTGRQGGTSHQISNACFIEALLIFFLYAVGVTTFMGLAVNTILCVFLIFVGIVLTRYEGSGGFVTG